MSHCRASSIYDHLDHSFVIFKDVQQSFLTRRIHVSHCLGASGKVNTILDDAEHDLSSRVQDKMGLSKSFAKRSSQLHQIQRRQTLLQDRRQSSQEASTLKRWRQRTLSRRRAAKCLPLQRPSGPFGAGDDETMEQEEPESKRQRSVAGLPVCSLLIPVDEIPVSYVARTRSTRDLSMITRRINRWLHIW